MTATTTTTTTPTTACRLTIPALPHYPNNQHAVEYADISLDDITLDTVTVLDLNGNVTTISTLTPNYSEDNQGPLIVVFYLHPNRHALQVWDVNLDPTTTTSSLSSTNSTFLTLDSVTVFSLNSNITTTVIIPNDDPWIVFLHPYRHALDVVCTSCQQQQQRTQPFFLLMAIMVYYYTAAAYATILLWFVWFRTSLERPLPLDDDDDDDDNPHRLLLDPAAVIAAAPDDDDFDFGMPFDDVDDEDPPPPPRRRRQRCRRRQLNGVDAPPPPLRRSPRLAAQAAVAAADNPLAGNGTDAPVLPRRRSARIAARPPVSYKRMC